MATPYTLCVWWILNLLLLTQRIAVPLKAIATAIPDLKGVFFSSKSKKLFSLTQLYTSRIESISQQSWVFNILSKSCHKRVFSHSLAAGER
jgi:hypothetical protein